MHRGNKSSGKNDHYSCCVHLASKRGQINDSSFPTDANRWDRHATFSHSQEASREVRHYVATTGTASDLERRRSRMRVEQAFRSPRKKSTTRNPETGTTPFLRSWLDGHLQSRNFHLGRCRHRLRLALSRGLFSRLAKHCKVQEQTGDTGRPSIPRTKRRARHMAAGA